MLRCNKCGQSEPHLGDSWCLGCSAVEALAGELRCGWGAPGTRLLAHDILTTAVRQIRAVRRLGIAGAGRDRVRTPERAGTPVAPPAERSSLPPPPKEAPREPAPEVPEPEGRAPAGEGRAGSVKAEKPDEESEYEYTDNSEGEDPPELEDAGLKAVPKAAASRSERSEIPRRRAPEESEKKRSRDRARDTARSSTRQEEGRERSRDRGRRRRSRSRRHQRRDEEGQQAEPRKKRRHRKGHRGGAKHQKVWRAQNDPFRRFHYKQPDDFCDRPPASH